MPHGHTQSTVAVARSQCRTVTAFWLFGFINAILYAAILSATLDLVGSNIPKGVVLLVNVAPSFLVKLLALPLNFHTTPYWMRIPAFALISICGMFLIAFTGESTDWGSITFKMTGIALASVSSGGGDLSFLALTNYYGHPGLAAWSSGTGAAALTASSFYLTATTWLGFSVKQSLLLFSLLPILMLVSYFIILPGGLLQMDLDTRSDSATNENLSSQQSAGGMEESDALLASTTNASSCHSLLPGESVEGHNSRTSQMRRMWTTARHNMDSCRAIFYPYILPLMVVYIAEYTIDQGVSPTLLYPLSSTPFKQYREFYPTYIALYQLGVFLGRSSTSFFRIYVLYPFPYLQFLNLVLLLIHAMFNFIPSVYVIFLIIFWEGLIGGLAYVNTFAKLADEVPIQDRELYTGAISAGDSAGVLVASFLSMGTEVFLCNYQVQRGMEFCRQS
ncbi:Batten's disease protein Cln3 [Trichoderma afarasin]